MRGSWAAEWDHARLKVLWDGTRLKVLRPVRKRKGQEPGGYGGEIMAMFEYTTKVETLKVLIEIPRS
ncbi:hypothetical protein [Enterocloster sp.]|uniref:hypothetical protein n=1 Tax=Enterocloster sp. TaxID=2719315 RepID=UPI0039A24914